MLRIITSGVTRTSARPEPQKTGIPCRMPVDSCVVSLGCRGEAPPSAAGRCCAKAVDGPHLPVICCSPAEQQSAEVGAAHETGADPLAILTAPVIHAVDAVFVARRPRAGAPGERTREWLTKGPVQWT